MKNKNKARHASANDANGSELLREEEVAECPPQVGYRVSIIMSLIMYPLAVLPLGAGLLFAYWYPHLWIRVTCRKCSLATATYVIVKDLDGKYRVERVHKVEQQLQDLDIQRDQPTPEEDEWRDRETLQLLPTTRVLRYFLHRHLRYFYDEELGKFVLLHGYEHGQSCTSIHDMSKGLTSEEHQERHIRYGPNLIDVPVKPYHVLFIEEVLHPFYLFQVFSIVLWSIEDYYYYAAVVFFVSTVSVLISLIQTRRHMKQLHDMVHTSCTVTVLRNGRVHKAVSSSCLVPGDVLIIPPGGMAMPCDAALLSGSAIVNEAMLTGESVPVTKTSLPHDTAPYSPEGHKRHTIFCGTQVIQTRFYANTNVIAVVVRTGFATSKGGMVRSILFPKPLNVKFYADAMKFVLAMGVIAAGGFIYTMVIELVQHYSVKGTILRAFDVVTTVVPPALPAALTVGTVYALNRLRKQKIYCISPQRVNLCGKIKLVCFDKTGTLTEDSLDLYGVRPAQGAMFSPLVEDPCCLLPGPMLYGMATCHSLTTIEGKLTGDPLDLKMFQATKWVLEEPATSDSSRFDTMVPTIVHPPSSTRHLYDREMELGVLKQFTFSSELQRMSVLVRTLPSPHPQLLHAYVKGAPEMIKRLCVPETVPAEFYEVLQSLTQQGYRVLALAHKTLHMPWHKAERVKRDVVECDLTFVGLMVMQNRLKPETTPVIKTLINANIRPVMITGDNLLTAVSVARECTMVGSGCSVIMIKAVLNPPTNHPALSYHLLGEENNSVNLLQSHNGKDFDSGETNGATQLTFSQDRVQRKPFHLAVDGKSFAVIKEHCPEVFQWLLVKGTVFARMSPVQKAQLVTSLMSIGYGVAMCGDGANDCGALKAAHTGISLSDTEASVASPFTSKEPNITCVPIVIREGRAALVTSFSAFKYMALYSLTEFISVAILNSIESNLGDLQYLYIDLVLVLSFAFVMGFTGPYPRLVRQRPPGTLAGVHVLLSIIVQTILLLSFQLAPYLYLKTRPWYVPLDPDPNGDNIVCSENTVIFTSSIFHYIGLVIALSTAAPFRKPFITNYWFVLCLIILIPANLYMALAPIHWWPRFWKVSQLQPPPPILFRVAIVEMALVYCVVAYLLEGYIFPSEWMRKFLRVVRCKRRPYNRYKHILASIPPSWPAINSNNGTT